MKKGRSVQLRPFLFNDDEANYAPFL
jgi:hypothetical protein